MINFICIAMVLFSIGIVISKSEAKETIPFEEYRSQGGNSYVKLSDGWTNYELTGDANAKRTVVLIHGGTIPLCIWESQMEALKSADIRILRYDQYGRGFSGRPDGVYSRELFSRQLKELLDSLKITTPVDIIGPSFGGAIAVTFTSKFPERVRSILLISPALNVINSNSPLSGPLKLMRNPIFGNLIYKLIIKRKLIARAGLMIPGGDNSSCKTTFKNQFKCKGTDRALHSLFRSDSFEDYRDLTRITGSLLKKILLLHGQTDKEITPEMIKQIREDLPECQFVELQNSGHSPGTDAADKLNKIIVDFVTSE